jgi:hypothetical protein
VSPQARQIRRMLSATPCQFDAGLNRSTFGV